VTELTGTFTNSWGYEACLGLGQNGAGNGSFTYTYPTAEGNATITVNCQQVNIGTYFQCGSVRDFGYDNSDLVTSIVLGDGSKMLFTYESQVPNTYTGRLASVTYPSGNTVNYTYTGPNNGINCLDGSTAGLIRTDADGTYTFTRNTTTWLTTTMVGPFPANNTSVYTFSQQTNSPNGMFLTKEIDNQGSSTPLKTTVICYNTNETNCPTATAPTYPITQIDTYTTLGGMSASSRISQVFDSYGNLAKRALYDFGATTPTIQTLTSYGQSWNGTSCTPYPSGTDIYSTSCYTHTQNSAGDVAKTQIAYNATGHPTSSAKWTSGSSWLTSTATYNSNGTLATATDVNGTISTPAYNGTDGCNGLLPTSVTTAGLTTSIQWNCNGGVVTQTADANHQPTNYTYNDPLWRVKSMTDPLGIVTNYNYLSPTTTETVMNFNGAISTADALVTTDGLGRIIVVQKRQGQESSTFDSTQTAYGWSSTGSFTTQSMPYPGTSAEAAPSGTAVTTTQYDALGRRLTVKDGGGGTTSYSYWLNDVLETVSPAPTGENTKRRQLEYDGLGRLTSICEVTAGTTAWPGGSCAQANPQTGYWTKYAYDALGNLLAVTENAQGTPQTRTYTYDGLSRLVSESNPETGSVGYTYDNDSICGTSSGDLVKKVDAATNVSCFAHDALHRVTGVTYPSGPYSSSTPAKTFVYDTTTFSCTNSNVKGRLAEAFTGPSSAKITDIAYCYSARGETTDAFESTPDSNGYYHTTASYWANGALSGLIGVPSHNGWTFGVDGEGRPNSALDGTTNLVTATAYNTASQPTGIMLGSGDSDTYTYDPNTGRMATYEYNVGSTPKYVTGTLGWNQNWSLGSLVIADAFNSADAQTCGYSHDDLSRLQSVSCGPTSANGATWGQTFSYDAFGNISKSGTSSFLPTYTGNQFYQIPGGPTGTSHYYDLNGNLVSDLTNTYAWDSDANDIGINLSGSAPINLTYDALDRVVEQNNSGVYKEILYSPVGKLALMTKQVANNVFLALPGGEQATYTNNTIRFRHYDWLGSARFESNMSEQEYGDAAYAPFGETYAIKNTPYLSFTGQQPDTLAGLYDYLYREYNPVQGRWISPDRAGLSASDPTNPQSWNRYAYVLNDPLSNTDPLGLWCYYGTTNDDGSIDQYTTDTAYDSNYDMLSNSGECGGNGGQWYPDDTTTVTVTADAPPNVATIQSAVPDQIGAANNGKSAADLARCAAKVGNSLSLAALLPQGSNQFLQNALSNDFSTVSDLVTGPAGATRLDAAGSVLQGKLTTTAVKAVGAIPIGPDIYTLGVNGAGTTFVEDVVTTPLAEKALGQAAGALLGTAVDIKLAWDAATYAYGVAKCW
jgi:RHS repeat-associated protein